MAVKRIVTNIAAGDVLRAQAFYGDFLGLELAMDMGWILTFTADTTMTPQLSAMTEGGSGTPVPDISIEVDDVDATHRKAVAMGFKIEYGPADEPWGVRRFYVRDPFGRLVNILAH
jgi:catechol 2,3-dioxygenase-like lactoylglutathione lyase family enzyme